MNWRRPIKHFKYGGSTAHRTLNCPAWVSLAEELPKQIASEFASVGSMLHNCMEELLLGEFDDPKDCLGYVYTENGVTYTVDGDHVDEKLLPAQAAFDELCTRYNLEEYEAETTMEYNEIIGGTADFVACGNTTVVVGDWKFGDGVMVEAEGNMQGVFYAWLASQHMADMFEDAEKLVIVIIQPNNRGEDDLRIWEVPTPNGVKHYLEDFQISFLAAVGEAEEKSERCASGGWCKFCPATPVCPIKTGLAAQARRIKTDSMAHEEVSRALHLADEMEDWIKYVRNFAHEQAEEGVKFDGFKLVQKKAYRKWKDQDEVERKIKYSKKLTKSECYDTKLRSPAQIEKLCKKKGIDFSNFADHTHSTSSGTTLAHESDKRPEILGVKGLQALKDRLS